MGEYIERQAAIDALGEEPEIWCETDEEAATQSQWEMDKVAIEAVPPADVRPVKHGKWIVKTDSEGKTYGVCSCCGYKQYAGHLKYCPECGGKMDE